ncbi:hypothetical protein Forpi1262_v013739 [Fusarium oxysporum f. sp. raphani]|uniref:Uncharacterized protein n=1 Tax=Fusarium oxysporum f. sp. raphani TaxID=96318 RepID=A0A8J5PW90_FUSOX|nr:hypothetical protein Forpi1262_v013739 [Fusarium oxysporum f. sp. raphani]
MISFALGITNGEDPDPHSQPPLTQYPEASSKTTSHRATAIFAIAMCTWKKTLCTGHVLLWMPQVGRWCGKGPELQLHKRRQLLRPGEDVACSGFADN